MPHVTFIHGIANKPPAEDLLRVWRQALAEAAEPFSLSDLGVSSSMVYWADLMYGAPATDSSAYEGVLENTAEAIDGGGGAEAPVPQTAEEAAFLTGLRSKLTTLTDQEIASEPPTAPGLARQQTVDRPEPQGTLERVPLPWFIKRHVMSAFLRDVHHYLFDVEFAPPGGQPVRIQKTIRQRFVDVVCNPAVSRPHIVVSHSMGTVIAYDCLKRVGGCSEIDGFITIGSPLGLDEVQDKLQPGWSRADGFPKERLAGKWINLFDRLDPVCGFDPLLANDYRGGGTTKVEDVVVQNDGAWRHSATKYLRQPRFSSALRELLKL